MAADKNQRQIEVYRAITMLKRGRPADVVRMVAPLLGQPADDSAFKRAIHRDLKSLMHSNQIGVDYYTPGGELIPPGEEGQHQNVRVEYYMLSHMDQEITGFQRFVELGGDLLTKPILHSCLKFSEDFDDIPVGAYKVSLEMQTGFFLHLWFEKEDRPLRVILARTSKDSPQKAFRDKVLQQIDKRTVILFLPNKSISRFKAEDMTGHCEVSFLKEEGKVQLKDFKSHNGTFKAYAEDIKTRFLDLYINDQTMDRNLQNLMWGEVKGVMELESSNLLKAGNSLLFVDCG